MKFKPRLPLSGNPTPRDNDVDEIRAVEETTEVEAPDNETAETGAVVGAFEAVAQVVSHEMESVKRSIGELETRLGQRLETQRENMSAAIADLRHDMIARVESLRQDQQNAVSELSEQSKSSITGVKAHLEPALEQAKQRTEQMKTGLEQIMAAKEHKLEQELEVLKRGMSGVRNDLERQITTSGRVSSLLNNMADVFADPDSLPDEETQRQVHAVNEGPVR